MDRVLPYWTEAVSIKEKILSWTATDEYIEDMYQKCVESIHSTLQYQNTQKAQQLTSYLQSLQETERLSKEADQKDIQKLDEFLSSF